MRGSMSLLVFLFVYRQRQGINIVGNGLNTYFLRGIGHNRSADIIKSNKQFLAKR